VEFKQGGRTGSEASEVRAMRRCEEKPGAHRSIWGVQNGSWGVLSPAHDAEHTRLQGIREAESLDAVVM